MLVQTCSLWVYYSFIFWKVQVIMTPSTCRLAWARFGGAPCPGGCHLRSEMERWGEERIKRDVQQGAPFSHRCPCLFLAGSLPSPHLQDWEEQTEWERGKERPKGIVKLSEQKSEKMDGVVLGTCLLLQRRWLFPQNVLRVPGSTQHTVFLSAQEHSL